MAAAEADVRGRLQSAIAAKPGIHLRELQRMVGISLTGVSHHLHALEKLGAVVGISDSYYRRYFASDLILPQEARRLSEADRQLLAECRRPGSLGIVLNLAADGPMSHAQIRTRLRRSKGTVTYHLSRLIDAGMVKIHEGSAGGVYELADRARTVSILTTFSATLSDHVDGFARLWSSLREPPSEH